MFHISKCLFPLIIYWMLNHPVHVLIHLVPLSHSHSYTFLYIDNFYVYLHIDFFFFFVQYPNELLDIHNVQRETFFIQGRCFSGKPQIQLINLGSQKGIGHNSGNKTPYVTITKHIRTHNSNIQYNSTRSPHLSPDKLTSGLAILPKLPPLASSCTFISDLPKQKSIFVHKSNTK